MSTPALVLYGYWRSSAAYRVRIGLHLKQLAFEQRPVHLVRGGGEQHLADYAALNSQELVPTLIHAGQPLSQSLAILEYLDEMWPQPALLPADSAGRARVRGLAQQIACDIHPLNNLRVMQYLDQPVGVGPQARNTWMLHWMAQGLQALESQLANSSATGAFCHGHSPTLADACLVPQLYNARRFGLAMDDLPTLCRIEQACLDLPAFDAARPEHQPDAVA